MLKRAGFFLASLLMLHGGAGASQAPVQSFSVWQAGTANLGSGQSFASAFDVSVFHDPARDHLADAIITLNFVGSGMRAATPVGSFAVVTQGDGYYTTDTTTLYSDPLDSVQIVPGDGGAPAASASDVASIYSFTSGPTSITPVYGPITYCSGGPFVVTCGVQYVHVADNHNFDRTDGYQGAFSYSSTVDPASLNALASTGLLRYGFTVTSGGVALQSATLSFTTSPVPEPSTLILSLMGLAVLIGWVRRRRYGSASINTFDGATHPTIALCAVIIASAAALNSGK